MGRQKKNELESVLEQLKMSYSADHIDDLEDSLLDSETSEEDEELSSILERIFADNESTEVKGVDVQEHEKEQSIQASDDITESENAENDDILDNSTLSDVLDSQKKPNSAIDSQSYIDVEIKTEEEKVDEILDIIFGAKNNAKGTSSPSGSSTHDEVNDISIIDDKKDISSSPEPECSADIDKNTGGEVTTKEIKSDPIVVSKENDAVEESPADMNDVSEDNISNATTVENNNEAVSADEVKAEINIILDEENYIFDPLQCAMTAISLYKPEEDIDLSVTKMNTEESDSLDSTPADNIDTTDDITDKDISLLMKLGYDCEISENGDKSRANKVIFEQSKEYIPEKHKIKHGFIGREFYYRDDIPDIKKKYKNDMVSLLIKAVVVSVIALLMTFTDIVAAMMGLGNDTLVSINSLLAITVAILMFNRLYSGIYSLVKYDGNEYSLASILLIEYLLSNLAINIINLFVFEISLYASCGGYVLLIMAFTVWSEWLDCCREISTFDFISSRYDYYVAEKQVNQNGAVGKRAPCDKFIVKRANLLTGYHNKIIESKKEKVQTFILIGVLPLVSVIFGALNILFNKNFIMGINISTYIMFFSIPLSSVISISVLRFADHKKLREKNAVFIGSDFAESLSSAETLVFEDTDVVETTSYREIDPSNRSDNSKKWSNIAKNVIEALCGPTSKAMCSDLTGANIGHEITINEISENGVDLYFDSSMNILIGDRHYLMSHNIKVKTDVNLTGAIKGAERSVIYMAFDKIPRIGYILNCKIKGSFMDIVEILQRNSINIEVRSYEPQISEYFFELNNISHQITVERPKSFEKDEKVKISDTNIVSSDAIGICRAIEYSKRSFKDDLECRKSKKYNFIIGSAVSCLLAFLKCLPIESDIFERLWMYAPILLYIVSFAILSWNIIKIVKTIKRK